MKKKLKCFTQGLKQWPIWLISTIAIRNNGRYLSGQLVNLKFITCSRSTFNEFNSIKKNWRLELNICCRMQNNFTITICLVIALCDMPPIKRVFFSFLLHLNISVKLLFFFFVQLLIRDGRGVMLDCRPCLFKRKCIQL